MGPADRHPSRSAPRPDAGAVLTKAVLRAATTLGLAQKDLAAVVGVSAATVSRLPRGGRLEPDTKEGELALLLLRVFRSLDALVGGREEKARAWFHADNHHLAGVPAMLVRRVEGLVRVADHLDALRGRL